MRTIRLDKNRTVWQRLQAELEPEFGRAGADRMAAYLLPYVLAERRDAAEHGQP